MSSTSPQTNDGSTVNHHNGPSVLVIGSTGGMGTEIIRHLAASKKENPASSLKIHAFCRTPSKLEDASSVKSLCDSVIQGNARNSTDIEKALSVSNANFIIVSVGNGEDVKKNNIREESAKALVQVLPKYPRVRGVIVISSTGAGSSKIVVGMGIGKLISHHLRHILHDHSQQESTFLSLKDWKDRMVVVRATALTDGHPTGKLLEFGDTAKSPTIKTDRADLAAWVTNQVVNDLPYAGKIVNVTSVKNKK
mmetsp:Transcript_3021/g.4697  ORF Transcript_3021/g.4697 Transcript_3021/m.4697 type:complete len:251 (+) Transcript_3021:104-856(+)